MAKVRRSPFTFEEIPQIVWKWQNILGLREWKVNVERQAGFLDDDRKNSDIEMAIDQDRKYLEATITVYTPVWGLELDGLQRVIIHELLHLSLGGLHPFLAPSGDDALEEAVQRLAVAIYFSQE